MTNETLPIYLLPGMSHQYPVYNKLIPLLPNAHLVQFIDPVPGESLQAYAERMAPQFPQQSFIGGVSFGGILAQEISRIVQPAGCVVIASIQRPAELPPWLRVWRLLGGHFGSRVLNTIGTGASLFPKFFRTKSTMRLTKLSGASGAWHRWATSAILDWSPDQPFSVPLFHVHGDADTTFPIRYTSPDAVIRHGQHSLPMSHPAETAAAIASFTESV